MNACDKGTGYLRIVNPDTLVPYERKPVWYLTGLLLPGASETRKRMSLVSFTTHMHAVLINLDPPVKAIGYGYTAGSLFYYPPTSNLDIQATGKMDVTISNVTYTILPKPGTTLVKCGLIEASRFIAGAPADMKGIGVMIGSKCTIGEIVGQLKISCMVGGVLCESQIVDLEAQQTIGYV